MYITGYFIENFRTELKSYFVYRRIILYYNLESHLLIEERNSKKFSFTWIVNYRTL